jgi:hypothetical protein
MAEWNAFVAICGGISAHILLLISPHDLFNLKQRGKKSQKLSFC